MPSSTNSSVMRHVCPLSLFVGDMLTDATATTTRQDGPGHIIVTQQRPASAAAVRASMIYPACRVPPQSLAQRCGVVWWVTAQLFYSDICDGVVYVDITNVYRRTSPNVKVSVIPSSRLHMVRVHPFSSIHVGSFCRIGHIMAIRTSNDSNSGATARIIVDKF